ncbi:hypothetical protein [Caldifermentibacillus hisashii]|uniref:hypothetical protein n=1 Tax=Caldifermentibacillus hisashii TaxID=996558 RepID=UPI0034D5C0E0
MTTSPVLVTILRRETPFFGDETRSRRHFGVRNAKFDDETQSRRPFEVENLIFWRRALFSSPF